MTSLTVDHSHPVRGFHFSLDKPYLSSTLGWGWGDRLDDSIVTIGSALRCQFLRSVNLVLKLLLEVGGVACAVSVKEIGFVAEIFSSPTGEAQ